MVSTALIQDYFSLKQHWCENLSSQKCILFNAVRESTVMADNCLVFLQISIGSVKVEPCSFTERYLTSSDDEIELVRKVWEGTGVEEEQNPVAITYPSMKSEQEVSLSVCLIK